MKTRRDLYTLTLFREFSSNRLVSHLQNYYPNESLRVVLSGGKSMCKSEVNYKQNAGLLKQTAVTTH